MTQLLRLPMTKHICLVCEGLETTPAMGPVLQSIAMEFTGIDLKILIPSGSGNQLSKWETGSRIFFYGR